MANRAYLYSLSSRPQSYSNRPETIRGLSEWNYRIPLSFLILVSGSTEVSASLISDGFDDEPRGRKTRLPALTGRFDQGVKRLERFAAVAKLLGAESKALATACDETFAFLEQQRDAFILLETIELDTMVRRSGFDSIAREHLERAELIGETIDAWPASNQEVVEHVRASRDLMFAGTTFSDRFDDRETGVPLGLSFWNPILYFSLWSRAEFEARRFDGRDLSNPKKYSAKEKFAVDDVIEHPVFGVGIVRSVSGTKMDVEFKAGDKTLVHAR